MLSGAGHALAAPHSCAVDEPTPLLVTVLPLQKVARSWALYSAHESPRIMMVEGEPGDDAGGVEADAGGVEAPPQTPHVFAQI